MDKTKLDQHILAEILPDDGLDSSSGYGDDMPELPVPDTDIRDTDVYWQARQRIVALLERCERQGTDAFIDCVRTGIMRGDIESEGS